MGEMRRANAHEERSGITDRFAPTLVIASAIIAAARLARRSANTELRRICSFSTKWISAKALVWFFHPGQQQPAVQVRHLKNNFAR
jgi:hypothetical protein